MSVEGRVQEIQRFMEVTLKPDLQKLCSSNLLMVNYRPHKFRETDSQAQCYIAVDAIANSTA